MQTTNLDISAMCDCISDMFGGVCASIDYESALYKFNKDKPFKEYRWRLTIHTPSIIQKTFASWSELSAWVRSQDTDWPEQVLIEDSPQAGPADGTTYQDCLAHQPKRPREFAVAASPWEGIMDEETKILAMTECLILWDFLEQTGEVYKQDAINMLHSEGKLHRSNYGFWDCPLCFMLRHPPEENNSGCCDCPWPGNAYGITCKCEMPGSPFNTWRFNGTGKKQARKAAAKKVLELLLSIEF